jgi:flagellar basal-body rod modification protein FlgD
VSTSTSGVTGATDTGAASAAAAASTSSKANALGQDAFLQLLVTELKHQDPTKPMDNQEYITQLATFSQLEKLTSISDSVSTLNTISESMTRLEDKISALETAIKSVSTDAAKGGTSATSGSTTTKTSA